MVSTVNTGHLTGPTEYRFLVSVQRDSGTGSIEAIASSGFPSIILIQDVGIATPGTAIDFGQVTPPVTKQNYTTYWKASQSATYQGNGTRRSDTGDMVHGTDPSGFNGNGCAIAIFGAGAYASTNSAEVGKSISAALAGATNVNVEVMAKVKHANLNTGAQIYYVGANDTSTPATLINAQSNYYGNSKFTIGQAKYVPLGANSAIRSVIFGQAPGGISNYARLDGATQGTPPVLKITYTR